LKNCKTCKFETTYADNRIGLWCLHPNYDELQDGEDGCTGYKRCPRTLMIDCYLEEITPYELLAKLDQ
jgi:hypothetical protein